MSIKPPCAADLVFTEAFQIEIETDLAAKRVEFPAGVARGDEMEALADRLSDSGTARFPGALRSTVGTWTVIFCRAASLSALSGMA